MISICEGYAADNYVIFNGPKSQFLIFKGKGCQATDCQIVVNNERLHNITSGVHLGHCISTLNKKSLIDAAGAQFWKSFNIFSADFGHIYPFWQCRLFTQYCCSFYGTPLWNFVHYNNICTIWRKALRKMWHVSPMIHCNIITLLSESKPLELGLMQRFYKFGKTIFQKGSPLIQSIDNIAIYKPRSAFGMNYCEIRCKDDDDFNTAHVMIDQNWNDSLNYQMIQSVNVLKDMIDVRDSVKECAILNMDDVMYIINDICLN